MYKRILSIFICLLFLASCAAKQEVVRPAEPTPYTGHITPEALRGFVGFGASSSIKSYADITIVKKKKTVGVFSGAFLYKPHGNLRMSVFGPFGLTMMDMLLTDAVFQAYLPPYNTLYEWISPGISLDLAPDNGSGFLIEDKGDTIVLSSVRPGPDNKEITVRYLFERPYLFNRSISVSRDGAELITLSFEEYTGRTPYRMSMAFRDGSAITIALKDPEIGSDVPLDYFDPVTHEDKTVLFFEDLLKRFGSRR